MLLGLKLWVSPGCFVHSTVMVLMLALCTAALQLNRSSVH